MTDLTIFKGKGFIIPKHLIPDMDKLIDKYPSELDGEYVVDPYKGDFIICEIKDEKTIYKTDLVRHYGGITCNVIVVKELKKPKPFFDEWAEILEKKEVIYAKFICTL